MYLVQKHVNEKYAFHWRRSLYVIFWSSVVLNMNMVQCAFVCYAWYISPRDHKTLTVLWMNHIVCDYDLLPAPVGLCTGARAQHWSAPPCAICHWDFPEGHRYLSSSSFGPWPMPHNISLWALPQNISHHHIHNNYCAMGKFGIMQCGRHPNPTSPSRISLASWLVGSHFSKAFRHNLERAMVSKHSKPYTSEPHIWNAQSLLSSDLSVSAKLCKAGVFKACL